MILSIVLYFVLQPHFATGYMTATPRYAIPTAVNPAAAAYAAAAALPGYVMSPRLRRYVSHKLTSLSVYLHRVF